METDDCPQIMDTSEDKLSPSPQPDPDQSVESIESDINDNSDIIVDVTDELNTSRNSTTSNDNQSEKKKKKRKMTPSERKRFLEERKKRQDEREALKEKRNQELKEKKELLEKQKLEKQMEKEKRDKERQEKEAERQRIKDEKQREKEEKQKEREDKLKEKEAERLKRLEECQLKKRKLEEENARKEEEKRKKCQKEEKQKNILMNFFIKKSSDDQNSRKSVVSTETTANGLFLPFHLGENQTLAPIVRESAKNRFNREVLDSLLMTQDSKQLYLDSLKSFDYKPLNNKKQKTETEPEIIAEDQPETDKNQTKRYRVKHLQFHENVRPPYRGTFSKTTEKVKPTQPFRKDSDIFDYEVDSDDEWEEGGPGESLNGSDSEGSVKDDYEIDNDFFVPHGYLSEDENEENEDKGSDNIDRDVPMTEDNADQIEGKCRPLLKEQVLMAERNRSFSKTLIPIVIGCVWETNLDKNSKKTIDLMQSYRRVQIVTK